MRCLPRGETEVKWFPQEHRLVAEQPVGPGKRCLVRPLRASAPARGDAPRTLFKRAVCATGMRMLQRTCLVLAPRPKERVPCMTPAEGPWGSDVGQRH